MAFNPDVKEKIVRDKKGNRAPCVMCGVSHIPCQTRFTSSTRRSGKPVILATERSTVFPFAQTVIESSTKYCGRTCTALFLRLAQRTFQVATENAATFGDRQKGVQVSSTPEGVRLG